MKHYTLPAFLLLLAAFLLLFGMLKSFDSAHRSLTDLSSEQSSAEQARREMASVQKEATDAKRNSTQSDIFLQKWTTEMESESSIERVFGRLDTLAVNNLLSPSGKNFTLNTNYFFDGRHTEVQNVNLTVAGDYARTLNWLGAAESAFPLARVEQISYTTNGSSLVLAVQFIFPHKFDVE